MTFATDLQNLLEHACKTTWSQFDWVKANASLYGLTKRASDKWATPGEPAFVSMLAEYPFLRRRLARILQAHLPAALSAGTPLVSGTFAHQPPKVRTARSATQVELGDLLVVRHHFRTGQARPEGRALLVQAKASTTPRTGPLTGRAAHRFDLYADWAIPFTFPNGEIGAPPSGDRWDFAKGPAPHELSGVYAVVSSQRSCRGQKFPDNCPWAVGAAIAPEKGLPRDAKATLSLAAALEGVVDGRHGRPWHVGAAPDDHWSHFVEQVLKRSIDWELQVQRIGGVDLPKKRSALSFIQSFLSLEVNAKLMLSPADRELSFDDTIEDLISTVDSVGRQAKAWAASIEGDDDAPAEPAAPQDGAKGGMSVLYIATFGDEPLAAAQADWVPAPVATPRP